MKYGLLYRHFVWVTGLLLISRFTWAVQDLADIQAQLAHEPKVALEQVTLKLQALNDSTLSINHEVWFAYKEIEITAQIKLGLIDKAKASALQLYAKYDAINTPINRAKAAFLLAIANQATNNSQQSVAYLEEAMALIANKNEPELLADILANLGHTFRYKAKYEKALSYTMRALKIAIELKNPQKQANFHNQIGVIYDYIGNVELALVHHERSLRLQKQLGSQQGISNSLYNIGEIYRDLNKLTLALSHFSQALVVDKSLGNPIHIANSHSKLAQVNLSLNKLSDAKSHVENGLALVRGLNAPSDISWQLSILASIYMAMGELGQAKTTANEALELAMSANANRTERTVRLTLIEIAVAQQADKEALNKIENMLALPNLSRTYQSRLYQLQATLYERNKAFKKAVRSHKAYQKVQQALFEHLDQQQTERLKKSVEVVRQDHELSLLQKEQALQKASLANLELQRGIVILLLLLLFGVLCLIYTRQKQKQRLFDVKAKLLADNLEQKNRLLADVSHELRTPLTALKLSIETLQFNLEPNIERAYAKVHSKISQLDNLISDIYRSAQFDNNALRLNKGTASINALIEDVAQDFLPRYRKKHNTLAMNCPVNIAITIDAERVKQVLINLLNNSLAYTNDGGETRITMQEICEGVEIIVEDSAPGLTDVDLTRVFERLYRCEESRSRDLGGSGLGLSICLQIVLAHEGRMYAEHSDLGGVKFVVVFPFG
jgi:signal transduction histidine kinase